MHLLLSAVLVMLLLPVYSQDNASIFTYPVQGDKGGCVRCGHRKGRVTQYVSRRPIPKRERVVDRVYVETAHSNTGYRDHYYLKARRPYSDRQRHMIYNPRKH